MPDLLLGHYHKMRCDGGLSVTRHTAAFSSWKNTYTLLQDSDWLFVDMKWDMVRTTSWHTAVSPVTFNKHVWLVKQWDPK